MRKCTKSFSLFRKYAWINLIGFSLFYNMVYIGRFNLNHSLEEIAADFQLLAYQETLLYTSLFLAYATGSLINGQLVDRYGGKKMVVLGAVFSIFANMIIPFADRWQVILCLSLINGYFQSMIWLGGIKILVNWWRSKERGLGGGIANFFSGFSHVTAYLLPSGIMLLYPGFGWRINFMIPMILMGCFLLLFYCTTKNTPETEGFSPYVEDDQLVAEKEALLHQKITLEKNSPWKYFFFRKHFLWWCGIALLSSLCRYGLLNWIPRYYAVDNGGSILSQSFSSMILPLGMAFGTLTLTWVTGRKFAHNKGLMISMSAALCGALVVIFPTMESTKMVLVGIFCTGFFLYGINGILWIYAMDEGGRAYAGMTAGILNCLAYVGAAAETFLFPAIVKAAGQMISIFIAMEALCIAMMICGIVVSEKDTKIEVELS